MPKTTYVWDELSDNVIEEYEDGVLSASYTHEPRLYGNLLSQNRGGVTSYYHYDGRGDTVALTNDAGNITDTKDYDAWGNVIAATGSTQTPYAFVGRSGYQTVIGGTYVRARIYYSAITRWLSQDAVDLDDGPNLFHYSRNSPISRTDPSGNTCCPTDADCEDSETILSRIRPRKGHTEGQLGVNMVLAKDITLNTCGGFSWKINWIKSAGAPGKNGTYLLQHIVRKSQIYSCCDNSDITLEVLQANGIQPGNKDGGKTLDFWEAWQFGPGETQTSHALKPGSTFDDDYAHNSLKGCSWGSISIVGEYTEVDGLIPDPPMTPGTVGPAGVLHSSYSEPPFVAKGAFRFHDLSISWRCCTPYTLPPLEEPP